MVRLNTWCLSFAIVLFLSSSVRPQEPASGQAAAAPGQDGQRPQPAAQATPVYETATVLKAITRLVVVDVVATDKKGNAVTDLERRDFTILEDGTEQQVRVFSFQQPVLRGAGAAAPPGHTLPANVFTNVPRYNTSSALNVVLLDGLNTTLPHQAYVRDQMIHYLEKMPEGQPVAIYTLGSKLTLLQDFTSDPEVLKEVVKRLKGKISPLLDNPGGGPQAELLPPGLVDSGMVPEQMLQSM